MLHNNTGKPCYITGLQKQKLIKERVLGGYWGRGKCTGIHDNLYCTATYIYETKVPGAVEKITKENLPPSYNDMPIILISLDLIGTSAEFAKCQKGNCYDKIGLHHCLRRPNSSFLYTYIQALRQINISLVWDMQLINTC